jgi:adenylate cyclase
MTVLKRQQELSLQTMTFSFAPKRLYLPLLFKKGDEPLSHGERRLAAIMFTDVVGFTSLSQRNEALSLQLLEQHRAILRPLFPKHNGREIKTIGDAFLVQFGSALEAVECAVEMQEVIHNQPGQSAEKLEMKVGIHVGDVVQSEMDVFGDAVNIASRIEPLAKGGEICISGQVFDQVRNKVPFKLVKLEARELKNVAVPIDVYKVELPWEAPELSSRPVVLPSERVAVLPFVSMSPDPQDEYFADGLTEELITKLSQVGGLEVIARTSVMNYKKKEKNASQIGRELNVGTIMEGSVRKAGNRIRVTAQLINANTEGHLWSSTYDRNLDDIFAVQSDIATSVVGSLPGKISATAAKVPAFDETKDIQAYMYFLQGQALMYEREEESFSRQWKGSLPFPGHMPVSRGAICSWAQTGSYHGAKRSSAERRRPAGPYQWVRTCPRGTACFPTFLSWLTTMP